jgi:hypothetical protein
MNPAAVIFLCIFVVFLFVIYIVFHALGIDIFSEIIKLFFSLVGNVFGNAFYAVIALSMIGIIIIALILFMFGPGK